MMGFEIGVEGGELLAKHHENSEYHNYGKYDDNHANHKTVVRTYQVALGKVKKTSHFI